MSQKIPIWIQRISKIHVLCKTNCEYCGERGAKSCAGWRPISKKFWSLLRHLDAWKPQGQPFLQEVYFWPIKGSRAPTQLIVWVYSDYLNFFSLNSRYVADNLSHLGKCTELIIFEVEWVFLHFGGWITTKYHNFTLQHSKLLRCFWEKSNTALFSLFAQKLLWTAATFSICQKLLAELLFCYQKYIGNYLQRYFIKFHKICLFGIILKQLRHFPVTS